MAYKPYNRTDSAVKKAKKVGSAVNKRVSYVIPYIPPESETAEGKHAKGWVIGKDNQLHYQTHTVYDAADMRSNEWLVFYHAKKVAEMNRNQGWSRLRPDNPAMRTSDPQFGNIVRRRKVIQSFGVGAPRSNREAMGEAYRTYKAELFKLPTIFNVPSAENPFPLGENFFKANLNFIKNFVPHYKDPNMQKIINAAEHPTAGSNLDTVEYKNAYRLLMEDFSKLDPKKPEEKAILDKLPGKILAQKLGLLNPNNPEDKEILDKLPDDENVKRVKGDHFTMKDYIDFMADSTNEVAHKEVGGVHALRRGQHLNSGNKIRSLEYLDVDELGIVIANAVAMEQLNTEAQEFADRIVEVRDKNIHMARLLVDAKDYLNEIKFLNPGPITPDLISGQRGNFKLQKAFGPERFALLKKQLIAAQANDCLCKFDLSSGSVVTLNKEDIINSEYAKLDAQKQAVEDINKDLFGKIPSTEYELENLKNKKEFTPNCGKITKLFNDYVAIQYAEELNRVAVANGRDINTVKLSAQDEQQILAGCVETFSGLYNAKDANDALNIYKTQVRIADVYMMMDGEQEFPKGFDFDKYYEDKAAKVTSFVSTAAIEQHKDEEAVDQELLDATRAFTSPAGFINGNPESREEFMAYPDEIKKFIKLTFDREQMRSAFGNSKNPCMAKKFNDLSAELKKLLEQMKMSGNMTYITDANRMAIRAYVQSNPDAKASLVHNGFAGAFGTATMYELQQLQKEAEYNDIMDKRFAQSYLKEHPGLANNAYFRERQNAYLDKYMKDPSLLVNAVSDLYVWREKWNRIDNEKFADMSKTKTWDMPLPTP